MMIQIDVNHLLKSKDNLNDLRDLIVNNQLDSLKRELYLIEKEIENISKAIMLKSGKELIRKLSE